MSPVSRRAVLRGLGAAVALPWLPSLAGAEVAPAVARTLFWYLPVGALQGRAVPQEEGSAWTTPPRWTALERHRARLTLVSGLRTLDDALHPEADPHEIFGGAALTGEYNAVGRIVGPHGGRSVDLLLADTLGQDTPFASLAFGSDPGVPCMPPIRCAQLRNLSWVDGASPLTREVSLRRAFERLFGGGATPEDAEARARRLTEGLSVLDFVKDASQRLAQRLGREDRLRLEAWTDGVRAAERRIETLAATPACDTRADALDAALDRELPEPREHVEAMHELMGLALRCDRTRVLTYMCANETSMRVHADLGHVDTHHYLSHHGNDTAKVRAVREIEDWVSQRLAHLLDTLLAHTEPDGSTLLDATTVVALGSFGDPYRHSPSEVPVLLAGGRDQTGLHLRYPDRPLADLHLTLLRRAGRTDAAFGVEGTSTLAGLA